MPGRSFVPGPDVRALRAERVGAALGAAEAAPKAAPRVALLHGHVAALAVSAAQLERALEALPPGGSVDDVPAALLDAFGADWLAVGTHWPS